MGEDVQPTHEGVHVEDPIEAQVDAYNRRDLAAFSACYSQEVVIEDGSGTVLMRGRSELEAQYGLFFESSPDLHADVVTRLRVGEYVVDEEHVTGVTGVEPGEVRAIAIYHVADGLIDRVRILQ